MNSNNNSPMNNPIVSISVCVVSLFIIFITSYEPKPMTCKKEGCYKEASQGTAYCYLHNPNSYYNQVKGNHIPYSAPRTCLEDGCNNSRLDGYAYCSSHKCMVNGCIYARRSGRYCIHHVCSVEGCTSLAVDDKNQRCRSHINNNSTSVYGSANHSSSSHSSSSHTSSRVEWPDCDDYEDFDEFMDDWDGCMPDGSDAEDYWDNW